MGWWWNLLLLVGLTLSLAEKVSTSAFPSSLFEKWLSSATCAYLSGNFVSETQLFLCSCYAHHGQPRLDPLCGGGLTLSNAEKVSSSELQSSLFEK